MTFIRLILDLKGRIIELQISIHQLHHHLTFLSIYERSNQTPALRMSIYPCNQTQEFVRNEVFESKVQNVNQSS